MLGISSEVATSILENIKGCKEVAAEGLTVLNRMSGELNRP